MTRSEDFLFDQQRFDTVRLTSDRNHLAWGLIARAGAVGFLTSNLDGRCSVVFPPEFDDINRGLICGSEFSCMNATMVQYTDLEIVSRATLKD